MVQIDATYEGDLRCSAVHGPSGTQLRTDAPVDNQGKGELFSPTDLLATALGTCMLTIMGIVARRDGLAIEGTTVRVTKEMTAQPPRRIARLSVTFNLPAPLTAGQRQKLEAAAHTCPVHKSIHPDIEVPVVFNYPE